MATHRHLLILVALIGLQTSNLFASPEQGQRTKDQGSLGEYSPAANTISLPVPIRDNPVSDYPQFRPMEPSFTHYYSLPAEHERLFAGSQYTVGSLNQCMETMVDKRVCNSKFIRTHCEADSSPMFQSCVQTFREIYPQDSCEDAAPMCVNRPKLAACLKRAAETLKMKSAAAFDACSRLSYDLSDLQAMHSVTKVDPTKLMEIPADRMALVKNCIFVRGDKESESLKSLNDCYARHTNSTRVLVEIPKPEKPAPAPVAAPETSESARAQAASRPSPAPRVMNQLPERVVSPRGFVVFKRGNANHEVPIFYTSSDLEFLKTVLSHVSREWEMNPESVPSAVKVLRCPNETPDCGKYEVVTKDLAISCEEEKSSLARNLKLLIKGKAPRSGQVHQISLTRQITSFDLEGEKAKVLKAYKQSGFCN